MTADDLTTIERLTDQESEILRSWLSGNEVAAIARAKRLDGKVVAATIDGLCNYNRDTARHALATGVRQHMPPQPTPPAVAPRPVADRFVSPPPPPAAADMPEPEHEPIPTPKPEPLGEQAEPPTSVVGSVEEPAAPYPVREPRSGAGRTRQAPDPVEARRVQRVVDEVLLDHSPAVTAVIDTARALDTALRAPDATWYRAPWAQMTALMRALAVLDQAPDRALPPEPAITSSPGRVDQLLAQADQSTLNAVKATAGRVRAAADDLAAVLHQTQEEDRLRALIAERRRALDDAHEQLRQLTGKPAARAHSRRPVEHPEAPR